MTGRNPSVEELETQLGAARGRLDGLQSTASMRRGKQNNLRVDADVRRTAEVCERITRLEQQLAAARRREAAPQPGGVTAEQLQGATHVRTRHGWWRLVRVNAKTVTVDGGDLDDHRIPLGKLVEARKVPQ